MAPRTNAPLISHHHEKLRPVQLTRNAYPTTSSHSNPYPCLLHAEVIRNLPSSLPWCTVRFHSVSSKPPAKTCGQGLQTRQQAAAWQKIHLDQKEQVNRAEWEGVMVMRSCDWEVLLGVAWRRSMLLAFISCNVHRTPCGSNHPVEYINSRTESRILTYCTVVCRDFWVWKIAACLHDSAAEFNTLRPTLGTIVPKYEDNQHYDFFRSRSSHNGHLFDPKMFLRSVPNMTFMLRQTSYDPNLSWRNNALRFHPQYYDFIPLTTTVAGLAEKLKNSTYISQYK